MQSDRRPAFAAPLALAFFVLSALAALAAPASAGTLYVPLPPRAEGQSVSLLAFNRDHTAVRRYSVRVLPAGSDGVAADRENGGASTVPVAGRATGVTTIGADVPAGLLEISSAPQLSFEALLRLGAGSGAALELPLIDSDTVAEAGEFSELLGLERSDAPGARRVADVGVANLGHQSALCTARLSRAGGAEAGERVSFTLTPLSYGHFADALAAFGIESATVTTLRIACDQPYFAYAIQKEASGASRVVRAAASGKSTLVRPGEVPSGPPPGSVVFQRSGWVHTATPGKPTEILEIDVPAGSTYRRVEVTFDYYHAGWWEQNPEGSYSLFWLHRGRWLQSTWADNVYGYGNAFGPSRDEIRLMNNVDAGLVRHTWVKKYDIQPGSTYGVRYVYDTETQIARLTMTDRATGAVVAEVVGSTYGKPLVSGGQGVFFVYFGHQDETGIGPERPSFGSTWRDLEVVFVR